MTAKIDGNLEEKKLFFHVQFMSPWNSIANPYVPFHSWDSALGDIQNALTAIVGAHSTATEVILPLT